MVWAVFFLQSEDNSAAAKLTKKAAAIHEKVLTIDTHTDTPFMLLEPTYNIGESHDSRRRGGRVDFPRMKQGGLDAVFFAVYIGQGPRTPEDYEKVQQKALHIFDRIHKAITQHPDLAELALNPQDAYRIEKKGKRAIYIGVENGYPMAMDITMVKKFYDLGARYITLCHTSHNQICDSATDKNGPEHNGLSEFGKHVVAEMNRLGMLIDVSHISDKSFADVLALTKAPVIASHSCARAVCNNPRNLSDELLKKLAKNGGVIQLCILSDYLKPSPPNPERDEAYKALRKKYPNFNSLPEKEQALVIKEWEELEDKFPGNPATVVDAVNHIDHIVKVAGIDHVGIGSDFDGGGGITDCYDVSEMGNITLELVKRGYTEQQIAKIWGGNFIRVFKAVQKKAGK